MDRSHRIERTLRETLRPTLLEVIDDSAKHAGHAGAAPQGQTHYRLRIAAPELEGLSRVAAHQKIYALLDEEFKTGLHALAIEIVRPQ